jgi:hypothetical protein
MPSGKSFTDEGKELHGVMQALTRDGDDLGFILRLVRHDHHRWRAPVLEVELDAAQSLIRDVQSHITGRGHEDPTVGDTQVHALGGEMQLHPLIGLE